MALFLENNPLYSEDRKSELDAEKFIVSLYQEINGIAYEDLSNIQKTNKFLLVFNRSVDKTFISRAILGPTWKTSSQEERLEFSVALTNYLAKKYGSQFEDFESGKIEIQGVKKLGSKGFVVESKVSSSSSKSYDLIWQVVESKTGLKLINIKFEGISMIHTERAEVKNIFRAKSRSIKLLIKTLNSY